MKTIKLFFIFLLLTACNENDEPAQLAICWEGCQGSLTLITQLSFTENIRVLWARDNDLPIESLLTCIKSTGDCDAIEPTTPLNIKYSNGFLQIEEGGHDYHPPRYVSVQVFDLDDSSEDPTPVLDIDQHQVSEKEAITCDELEIKL